MVNYLTTADRSPLNPPGVKEFCWGCDYWFPLARLGRNSPGCCQYILIIGKCRGCPAGPGCTKRKETATNDR